MTIKLPDDPAALALRLAAPHALATVQLADDPTALYARTPFRPVVTGPEVGDFHPSDFDPSDFFTG